MIWAYVGFLLFIGVILAIDLGVLNKDAHVVKMKEALTFAGFTIALACGFAVFVYFAYEAHWLGLGLAVDSVDKAVNDGRLAAIKFLTGYVIELSLSMDNVFVIALIFQHLRVPPQYQHRVLFWGILGALAMRGLMIGVGAGLVARYHWVIYLFGVFLVITALKMLFAKDAHGSPDDTWLIKAVRKRFPVTKGFHEQHFLVTLDGVTHLTPLAIALILVETTDLIFAVDSIPAIFAITADPFLVFTSNVFAIICLRSLYFGLAGLIEQFRYLKVSLSIILLLVGVKMLTASYLKAWFGPNLNFYLLGVIALILAGGAVASVLRPLPPQE
jgi:tellurite resistance protein TerC